MEAEEKLEEAKVLMKERDSMFEEIDSMYMRKREEGFNSEKLQQD